jgi:hypothetical protein
MEKITNWIERLPEGEAFSTADLLQLGNRSALDQALSRLVKAGTLQRLARGIFIASTFDKRCDAIDPVASTLAVLSRRNCCPIQVSGTEALKRLGVPTRGTPSDNAYLWPAKARCLAIMGRHVHIRSVSPRKVAMCGRAAGLAVTAIWQIGKQKMSPNIMAAILKNLQPDERKALQASASALPTWAMNHMIDMDEARKVLPTLDASPQDWDTKLHSNHTASAKRFSAEVHNPLEQATETEAWAPSTAEGRWSGFGPYYAMFPVEFARQVVSTYCPPHGSVMDPFCGRGTVPFVALATGRVGLGSDINPVAWAYAKTKTDPYPDPQVVLRRARQIQAAITRTDRRPRNDFQALAWSRDVLGFLNAARRNLNWKGSRIDRTLMGILLVHLHAKLGNGFSNQIRQSKAMAPEYSVRWWREKQMLPPEIDIIASLEQKLEWRYKMGIVANAEGVPRPTILLGDSRVVLRRSPKGFAANLILTSPPYYGVTNYRYDNWIRLWLLGEGPALPETDAWARHGHQEQYRDLLKQTFSVCKRKSHEDAIVYVRTDARKFTLETTVDVLRTVWPNKSLYFAFDGFKKATQTALFGDKGLKPGEVDLLLLPSGRPYPTGMQLIEENTFPILPTNSASK